MIRSWLKILGYTLKRRNACHAILRNDFGEESVYYHGNRSTAYYVKRKKKPHVQHDLIFLKMQINRSYTTVLEVIFAFFFFLTCIFLIISTVFCNLNKQTNKQKA